MNKQQRIYRAIRIALNLLLLAAMVFLVWRMRGLTAQDLLELAPENYWYAAGWLLILYALKSLSVVFPAVVLQMAAGLIFPIPAAILVNLAGSLVGASVGYGVGRFSGKSALDRLRSRYPKIQAISQLYRGRELFFSYLLRVMGFLPMDVVSILLGSMGITYWKFLLGTLGGMLPGVLAASVMGASLSDPASPAFIGSLAASLLIAGGSVLLYRRVMRRNSQGEVPRN